jgi:hypothetical protein
MVRTPDELPTTPHIVICKVIRDLVDYWYWCVVVGLCGQCKTSSGDRTENWRRRTRASFLVKLDFGFA